MAYDSKKLAIYGATGFLISSFIIIAVQFVPMPVMPATKTGVLVLKITDAPPFMEPTSLNLTIDSIMIRREGNDAWITFELDGNPTFDLVSLVNVTDLLGAEKVPIGNYTQIRMHVLNATVSFSGEPEELTVPSDYIHISIDFTIKDDETTIIILDITYDSVVVSTHHHLSPVVHPIVEKQP